MPNRFGIVAKDLDGYNCTVTPSNRVGSDPMMSVRKVVILAGGLGTRLAEETAVRPKPLVEIGGLPILWHIMKIYSNFGLNDFIICLGYKGYMIKEYFANYHLHTSDLTFDFSKGVTTVHDRRTENWRVTLVDTGENTMTGGRLKRIAQWIGDEHFCMTYGDGVGNIDISSVIEHHRHHGKHATMTVVVPPGRWGAVDLDGASIRGFREKPSADGGWINAGFFVLSPRVVDYIDGDHMPWEATPLQTLAAEGELVAYRHQGFWQAMDTLRDKTQLESLWSSGRAPWRTWS